MAALEARDLWMTYDRVRYVLEGIDVAVDPGEVLVLMGRSGSGKTTLLNLLAGLETPSRGHVLVDGVDLTELDEEARTRLRLEQVGVVFQRFHLIPELTLEENVRLPLQLAERREARPRARELLDFFELSHRAQAFPSTLSGGETQRAAIARALANEPAIVLADEPTANLDEENALNALSALRRVADELETAVLVATHDPLARDTGDRLEHLADGRLDGAAHGIAESGAPEAAGVPVEGEQP